MSCRCESVGGQAVLRSDCVKSSPVTSHSQSLSEPISARPVGNFPLSPHWLVKSNYWKTVISSEEIQIYLSYSNLLGELPWNGRHSTSAWWYQVAEEGIACWIFVWLMWYHKPGWLQGDNTMGEVKLALLNGCGCVHLLIWNVSYHFCPVITDGEIR